MTEFLRGLGRRKEAVARVRLTRGGSGRFEVNGKELVAYFPLAAMRQTILSPFVAIGSEGQFDVSVKVSGGGLRGQADSVRLGISRALVSYNPEYRPVLKKMGFLTRDSRVRERKKYGLKSARRAPQWAKR